MIAGALGRPALETVERISNILWSLIENRKTDIDRELVFLGISGEFPDTDSGMALLISPHPEKATDWPIAK